MWHAPAGGQAHVAQARAAARGSGGHPAIQGAATAEPRCCARAHRIVAHCPPANPAPP